MNKNKGTNKNICKLNNYLIYRKVNKSILFESNFTKLF